jgi:uncharacterized protein (TIGR02231 family)
MKIASTAFLLIALSVALSTQAQKTTDLDASIRAVTVYPRGAQIEHATQKFLTSGRQILRFIGLPAELDPSSVGVSASNGISVLSVSTAIDQTQKKKLPAIAQELKDSLDSYTFDLKFNQNMLGVYQQEKNMILANQKVGWESSDFIIEDLEDLSDFYRERLADIMLKEMELQSKQERLQRNIARLKIALNEYIQKRDRSTGIVLVEINAPTNGNADFILNYMVYNAGWNPSYNVNAAEVDQPLQVSYNAKVYQNTGTDWEDVSLTLTNANPSLSGNAPELHPWRLRFIEDQMLYQRASSLSNKAMPMVAEMEMASDMPEEDYVDVDYPANEAVTQFNIKTKHAIPSNGKPQAISIDVFTIPAKYEYYTAPKLDPSAFLIARVADFEQYEMLPGEANLFLSNTYVGKTFLNPNVIGDTLDLSLGRDQSIIVKREKVKEFTASKKIGSSKKESIGIEISIKNTKRSEIALVIEDQIPISTDKEIEVSLDEDGKAKHMTSSGKLRWTKVIAPNTSEMVRFVYSVKYPSDRKINF